MFESVSTSVRLKTSYAKFITQFYKNKQKFMREAIEHYTAVTMRRVLEPVGAVAFHNNHGFGCASYYWNYYQGQQFIVIVNRGMQGCSNRWEEFLPLIYEKLQILQSEEIDFYVPCLEGKIDIWDNFNFKLFKNGEVYDNTKIPSQHLCEMINHMNKLSTHYNRNGKAFVMEQLQDFVADWEDYPSLHCKSLRSTRTHIDNSK